VSVDQNSKGNIVAAERRRSIVEIVSQRGSVTVGDLADALEVAGNTIRGDLDKLHAEGKLLRVHGGAVRKSSPIPRPPYPETRNMHMVQKAAIGVAALKCLPEAGSIFIGPGSTTYQFATRLPEGRMLHVVTSGLDIATYLLSNHVARLSILGGCLSADSFGTDASLSEHALEELYWNVTFMGASAVDIGCGMTTIDINSARLERKIIERGRKLVVLCDSSKLGSFSQAQVGPISMIDVLVTDSDVDPEFAKALTDRGVEVVVAGYADTEDDIVRSSVQIDRAGH